MSNEAINWAYAQSTGHGAGCKAVLVALADFADENGSCFPSQGLLAQRTEQDIRSVRTQLGRLKELGLLRTEARFDRQGHRVSDRYVLALEVAVQRRKHRRSNKPVVSDAAGLELSSPPENYVETTGKISLVTPIEPLGEPPDSSSTAAPVDATSSPTPIQPPRPEVLRLCNLLADLIAANDEDHRRPKLTKSGWYDPARLLLDVDGRDPAKVERAIRWAQADEFWRGNILSMRKLREKYAQLQAQARRRPSSGPAPVANPEWVALAVGGAR